jgi:phosphocarrier protein FPr
MVGLVLVSHSRQLAEAACRLAKGVGQQNLPIAFAGGVGDDRQELGTDATDIMDAINQVNAGDGVVVLMDLGSAVLSARLAEQMLEGDVPDIRLCPAPLVEGAVAAAIQIGVGANMDTVYDEAKNALGAKVREIAGDEAGQEAPAGDAASGSKDASVPADALLYRFTLDDPNGMHTRPAADFVKAVGGFQSEVRIRNLLADGPFVNARSLNRIALSAIRRGDISEVALWGPQAAETLDAVKKLVADVYHGREVQNPPVLKAEPAQAAAAQNAPLVRLSSGVALGTLYMEEDFSARLPRLKADDPEKEVARLDSAVAKVHGALDGRKKALGDDRQKEAAILDAQRLILDDAEVLDEIRAAIRKNSQDAASAYQQRMLALADSYRALPDAYMRERAADVDGVAGQVLAALAGKDAADVSSLSDVIIHAPEVSPALVGRWSGEQLKGILTREGGLTSHVAILAKAMGIPALMGYTPPAGSASGQKIALDANRLEVIVDPTLAEVADFEKRREVWRERLARDLADSKGTAVTEDGVRVPVWANIGDIASAEAAVKFGAEGVGLLRTEFLFLDRRLPPDEDEQTQQLVRLVSLFASLPVTIRTLDAGGDKAMPWLEMPPEANPFLGVRGVRLVMRYPDLFKSQLRAILRAGGEAGAADLRVMVPMVSTLEEVDFAKTLLETAHRELMTERRVHRWPVRFGIMVETPAAVLRADKLGERVDFFSIGTNDLTQYVMCAERGSKELASLSDGMHPAVLTAIALVASGAGRTGTEVAVCGEMAGDPVAAVALAALGVHHLSMNASSIGPVKRAIRKSRVGDLSDAAGRALGLSSAKEVRKLFAKFIG